MKIDLLMPEIRGGYARSNARIAHLGLLYVAAVLKQGGHQVRTFDLLNNPRARVDLSVPDVVGITCVSAQFNAGLRLAQEAKKQGKLTIMGGSHPTFTVEETLKTGAVDFIIRGEGEYTALELVNRLADNGHGMDFSDIPGISWLDRKTGRVVDNPSRPLIKDLDELPFPARETLDMEPYKAFKLAYRPAVNVVTSRGCPHNCSYCVSTMISGATYRMRKMSHVVDEIELLLREYGFGSIFFSDDNLTASPKRTRDLCREIQRRGLQFKWWCMSRVDTLVKNEELVREMAEAGCHQIFLGLESPKDHVLQRYNKRVKASDEIEAVRLLKKYGINVHGGFMIGALNETREDVEATIDFPRKLRLEYAQFGIATPLPGTRFYQEVHSRLKTRDWDQFDGFHALFDTDHLTTQEIESLMKRAYIRFFTSPHKLLSYLSPRKIASTLLKIKFVLGLLFLNNRRS
ncbi:MAG: B12-binding domain-containing radical SAM protein [Candidatus Tectomicrobia bacterium]|uniref:B12-binding domain-containing radical SAM protein n=1 Tax=Tectimicrobiota bacterium TaxID=2528274 RepID=A0A932CPZ6_UNCTE|nr:B12-binding domain-containing radical SAM protein [Candidatus Tectomicrobia bacterium]